MHSHKFREIAGSFATGVTVVTTKNKNGKPVGMTANSFSSLSLNPPLILFCIDKSASLYDDFMETNKFAINILAANQKYLSKTFSKRGIDRFKGVKFKTDVTGAPILLDTLGYFDCTVSQRLDGGDHTIIIGEVKNGDVNKNNPLIFYKGEYIS